MGAHTHILLTPEMSVPNLSRTTVPKCLHTPDLYLNPMRAAVIIVGALRRAWHTHREEVFLGGTVPAATASVLG